MSHKIASAIVAAGGSGVRMGAGIPKQLICIGSEPIVVGAIRAVASAPSVGRVVVAVPRGQEASFERDIIHGYSLFSLCECIVTAGGEDRQSSVMAALDALDACGDSHEIVLIHDGVRPFASVHVMEAVIAAASEFGAATCAIEPVDSVKQVTCQGLVEHSLDRTVLRLVQTPQAFKRELLRRAHRRAEATGKHVTDDCALVEMMGEPVAVIEGERDNIKITTPHDLVYAEAIMRSNGSGKQFRVGQGFDIHRMVPGRPLVIGGVTIPYDLGLLGHSDADVLAHAVCDAILGAVALGDIGRLFPDTDPAFLGADSIQLLERAVALCLSKGFRVVNLDATVIAQRPRIAPFANEMCAKLAAALKVPADCVNIKGKTTEGLGAIGDEQAIAAMATAMLARHSMDGGGPYNGD